MQSLSIPVSKKLNTSVPTPPSDEQFAEAILLSQRLDAEYKATGSPAARDAWLVADREVSRMLGIRQVAKLQAVR
jgi:hypothetical protein